MRAISSQNLSYLYFDRYLNLRSSVSQASTYPEGVSILILRLHRATRNIYMAFFRVPTNTMDPEDETSKRQGAMIHRNTMARE